MNGVVLWERSAFNNLNLFSIKLYSTPDNAPSSKNVIFILNVLAVVPRSEIFWNFWRPSPSHEWWSSWTRPSISVPPKGSANVVVFFFMAANIVDAIR